MRKLMEYGADKGSIVVNGVCFDNGNGDGSYDVFFSKELPKGFKLIKGVWFDLRDEDLKIWFYDCDSESFMTFTSKQLGCYAVQFSIDENGNFCVVTYF